MFSSERLVLARRYADLLATDGVVRGLIGPREVPRLWTRHLLNCGVLAEALPAAASVCDIGSGAGLPGLVVAIARPDVRVTLVEPLLRRTSFLEQAVSSLELGNVEVVRSRAVALHGERTFDVVTSRAVAPLGRLLEWSMPLVNPTGSLLALKGSQVSDEIVAARPVLDRFGCAEPELELLGESVLADPTTVLRVVWADPSAVSWPLARTPAQRRTSRDRRGSSRARKPRSQQRKQDS